MRRPTVKVDANNALFLAWMAYAGLNVLMVVLAAGGVIHPPWGVLTFFSVIGPPTMAGVVLILRLAGVRFDTAVLLTFLVVVGVMALLNLLVFGQAVAAV